MQKLVAPPCVVMSCAILVYGHLYKMKMVLFVYTCALLMTQEHIIVTLTNGHCVAILCTCN